MIGFTIVINLRISIKIKYQENEKPEKYYYVHWFVGYVHTIHFGWIWMCPINLFTATVPLIALASVPDYLQAQMREGAQNTHTHNLPIIPSTH